MITKKDLLECSLANFTKFGSKRFTLDQLAKILGISKKTIYKHFTSKEALVIESLESLLNDYDKEIKNIIANNNNDPILSIILIYKRGFEYLRYFKPSFIFGLKKYYSKAYAIFDAFRVNLARNITCTLLEKAKEKGHLKPEVNIELIALLYFFRIDNVAFKNDNLFETYGNESLLKHLIIYNLQGIISNTYSNYFFNQ